MMKLGSMTRGSVVHILLNTGFDMGISRFLGIGDPKAVAVATFISYAFGISFMKRCEKNGAEDGYQNLTQIQKEAFDKRFPGAFEKDNFSKIDTSNPPLNELEKEALSAVRSKQFVPILLSFATSVLASYAIGNLGGKLTVYEMASISTINLLATSMLSNEWRVW